MKISKVKWKDHPILGNLELDFINPATGEPYSTILFAGENGTGKTTIIQTISAFLNLGSFEPFEYIEYIVDSEHYKAVPQPSPVIPDFFTIIDKSGSQTHINSNRSNNRDSIGPDKKDIRAHGCVFSKARADYQTQQITATTTKQLDIDKYDIDKDEDFTSVKQLIVDIENQDNSSYADINRAAGPTPIAWASFYPSSKIYRFKNAFDSFFRNIEYDKVINNPDNKLITFTKNGKTISIDDLSTGEKQIVFRGAYLLKNNSQLDGAAIFIDEPELSLHPKWQTKILNYYKQLFTKTGIQKSQLFFATHSEYVLKDALSNKIDNLVFILKENNGVINATPINAPSALPSITSAETNYLAFDVVSNDYHIELYGYLQHKESKHTVRACDAFIKAHSEYNAAIHYKPSSGLGNTHYETLSTFIRNAIDHPDPSRTFNESELRTSIELLIELCR